MNLGANATILFGDGHLQLFFCQYGQILQWLNSNRAPILNLNPAQAWKFELFNFNCSISKFTFSKKSHAVNVTKFHRESKVHSPALTHEGRHRWVVRTKGCLSHVRAPLIRQAGVAAETTLWSKSMKSLNGKRQFLRSSASQKQVGEAGLQVITWFTCAAYPAKGKFGH